MLAIVLCTYLSMHQFTLFSLPHRNCTLSCNVPLTKCWLHTTIPQADSLNQSKSFSRTVHQERLVLYYFKNNTKNRSLWTLAHLVFRLRTDNLSLSGKSHIKFKIKIKSICSSISEERSQWHYSLCVNRLTKSYISIWIVKQILAIHLCTFVNVLEQYPMVHME